MATSALAGYKGLLTASTASGGSKTTLVEVADYTMTVEHSEIDATSHDSSGTREVIPGIDSWNGSAEVMHVMSSGEAGSHNAMLDVLLGKTLVDFEFVPTGSSSDGTYSGSGYVTNFELGAPNEDALNTSISFQGTGALTRNSSA